MPPAVPPLCVLQSIFFDQNACIQYLREKGAIYPSMDCQSCQTPMLFRENRRSFRCPKHSCRKEISIWKGTFFSKCKLPCEEVMNLAYHWLTGSSHSQLCAIGGHSKPTITALTNYLVQLTANDVNESSCIIGGDGVVVEIDESKLAKRKSNRGHHVEGVWVIGGVERTPERRLFACIVQDRSAETIKQIIYSQVHRGTMILTDCWRGYDWLDADESFLHQKVNHSKHFKDPETQVHTNTIEGTWSGLKAAIPRRTRTKDAIGENLLWFIWKRQNRGDLWDAFLRALADYVEVEG
jgi:IS1 family transposase